MFSESLPTTWIMYKGLYDFTKLYNAIKNWYATYQYEFHEKGFKNKADNIGTELELKLYGVKKIDEWVKYTINIHLHNQDVDFVEREINGKKVTLVKGRIRIDMSSKADFDYQNQFGQSPFWNKVENNYVKKILDMDIGAKYLDYLYYKTYELHALIKEVLNMDTAGNNY